MQDYILGTIFGISQVIIGHPFDTIKTNMQNKYNTNIFSTNPKLLYKGISSPLLMNAFGTSILFGNYNYFKQLTNNDIIAGVFTGITSSIILTPFDSIKIQLQTNHQQNNISNKHIANTSLHKIKLLYSGFTYTVTRESIAIPIYFYTYNKLIDITNPFIAGGIAGINSWLFTYPIDTLKTRKQLFQTKNIIQLINMGNLSSGLTITLIRAFIVNSSCFYIYEYLKKLNY